jgi:hypothetical protein
MAPGRETRNFRTRLIAELRRYRVFDNFRSEAIADALREPANLAPRASDSLPLYRMSQDFVLEPRGDAAPLLLGAIAHCEISFLSTTDSFDADRAVEVDTPGEGGPVSAAHVEVRICGGPGIERARWRKTLWSRESGHVEGDPDYVKLLI